MAVVTSSDKVFNNIDLLAKILCRLPAKNVGQCKCVSKQWQALISTPWFCHSHTQSSAPSSLWIRNSNIVSFTDHQSPVRVRTYLPFDSEEIAKLTYCEGPFIEIIQSCNGLLLCQGFFFESRIGECCYLVKNPVTGKSLDLPSPPDQVPEDEDDEEEEEEEEEDDDVVVWYHDRNPIAAAYLDFDPLKSFYFKVISFVKVPGRDSSRFRIYVFSSETHSWDEGEDFFTAPPGMKIDSGVYCNGAVHWYTPGQVSIYLDVHLQCFKALPEPPPYHVVKYFGELKGNLHLALAESVDKLDFHIFKLKDDYSGWIFIYHVDLSLATDGYFTKIPYPFLVVSLVLDGNEQDWMLVGLMCTEVVSYNLKDHTSRIFHDTGLIRGEMVRNSFHHYFETICNIP